MTYKNIKIKFKPLSERDSPRWVTVYDVVKHWVEDDALVLDIRKPGLYSNSEERHYPMHTILMWSVGGE